MSSHGDCVMAAAAMMMKIAATFVLNGDHEPTPVGDRETDVDGRDQYETEGVHRCWIEPPEHEWRRCLDSAPDDPPGDRPTHLSSSVAALQSPPTGASLMARRRSRTSFRSRDARQCGSAPSTDPGS